MLTPLIRLLDRYQQIGSTPSDSENLRLKKASLLLIPVFVGTLSTILTVFYAGAGHYVASTVPLAYVLVSILTIWHLAKTQRFDTFVHTQLSLVLVLPFIFTWLLGGFAASSFVCIWAIYAPINALIYQSYRHALRWFFAFLSLLITTVFLDRFLIENTLPPATALIELFTVLNIAVSTSGILFIIQYFIREQEKSADALLQKKHQSLLDRTEELKQAHDELQQLAHHDPLTQLANRIHLSQKLDTLLNTQHPHPFAVLFIDLDKFKHINDNYGHSIGDETLIAASRRLQRVARTQDFIARFGGDEFIIVTELNDSTPETDLIAQRILDAFSETFKINEYLFHITPSIGIAIHPDHGTTAETLLKHADTAMYQAKHNGRNNFCYYSQQLSTDATMSMEVDSMLRHAIARNELSLLYQIQVDTETNTIFGLEALLRWHPNQTGNIPPDIFIPIAEEGGQIYPIGQWVLQQSCELMVRLLDLGHILSHISVNVSGVQFMQEHFVTDLEKILQDTGLPSHYLQLELTESVVMNDQLQNIDNLHALSKKDILLSIDDFGTGYSSLSYLKRLPIDSLKIDRSFIRDICANDEDKAIAASIIALGKALNLNIIAEGVEDVDQLSYLTSQQCHLIQGYLFSRPVDEATLLTLLAHPERVFNAIKMQKSIAI